jgi:hypothetical protein
MPQIRISSQKFPLLVESKYYLSMKTLLQLLDFQKQQTILSHFDGFFGVFMSQEQFFQILFANFLPLLRNKNGVLTFLQ